MALVVRASYSSRWAATVVGVEFLSGELFFPLSNPASGTPPPSPNYPRTPSDVYLKIRAFLYFALVCIRQANAYFQWGNYLHDQCLAQGRTPLYINLDETPIPLTFEKIRGNVAGAYKEVQPPRLEVPRALTRAYMTLVSCICDRPEVGHLLPHVLLIGSKQLTLANYATLKGLCPDNVYVLRKKKGWNDIVQHIAIVRLLAKCLESVLGTYMVIFIFDACKLHLAPEVLDEIADQGFWFMPVPPHLTWLLQPLDVAAFGLLKKYLKDAFLKIMIPGGMPNPVATMSRTVFDAIRDILVARNWDYVFDLVGARGHQAGVANLLISDLQLEAIPPVAPRDRPCEDIVRKCWPNRMAPPFHNVWKAMPVLPALADAALPGVPPVAPLAIMDAADDPSAAAVPHDPHEETPAPESGGPAAAAHPRVRITTKSPALS